MGVPIRDYGIQTMWTKATIRRSWIIFLSLFQKPVRRDHRYSVRSNKAARCRVLYFGGWKARVLCGEAE
jgi:hypothetical protein